jgi:hypothetical protein
MQMGEKMTTLKKLLLAGEMTGTKTAAADIDTIATSTAGEKTAGIAPKISREAVVVYYDNTEASIEFSAQELQKTLSSIGHNPATLKSIAEMPAFPDACYVVIAKSTFPSVLQLMEERGGQRTGTMGAESYALRKTDNSTFSVFGTGIHSLPSSRCPVTKMWPWMMSTTRMGN